MRILAVDLVDYRSWLQAHIDFPSGKTLFLGPNGAGKTNIVEAIGFASTLGSHRTSDTKALIRNGATTTRINVVVEKEGRPVALEFVIDESKPVTAGMNANKVSRPRELLGFLPTVLFCPEDLDIIRRDPALRRAFIDELLIARYPRFASVMADFGRIIKQRGSLLKSVASGKPGQPRGSVEATLDAWDEQCANLAARVLLGRLDTLRLLQPHFTARHDQVSDSGKFAHIAYTAYNRNIAALLDASLTDVGIADVNHEDAVSAYAADLSERRDDEMRRGVCLVGPQRDDLALILGDKPAKGYASHGEMWSTALALKLGCFDVMRETHREDPVLILDDVFAELDEVRRERLADCIAAVEQVIITAAVAADVPSTLSCTVVPVERNSNGVLQWTSRDRAV